jgi:hypothetical protein
MKEDVADSRGGQLRGQAHDNNAFAGKKRSRAGWFSLGMIIEIEVPIKPNDVKYIAISVTNHWRFSMKPNS